MSNLTTAISVQVDTKDKEQATEILQRLGVTMSGLINMTLKQVIMRGGIPFEIREPRISRDMQDALDELAYIESHLNEYQRYNNREDLKKALLSDE